MNFTVNKSNVSPTRFFSAALLFFALFGTITSGAQCQGVEPAPVTSSHEIPYMLDQPSFVAELPKALDEISGLTALDSSRIAAVQDEDGVVFILDAASGRVVDRQRFRGGGDYEAIEAVQNVVFVLRSDGTIFEIRNWQDDENADLIVHDTWLSSRYDTEGLAVTADSTGLLVACKEYAGKGLKGMRAVYRFSLASSTLSRDPALVFDAQAAEAAIPEGVVSRSMRRLLDIRRFKPSGIAIHPLSGHVYVLSSVSRSLTIFDMDGNVLGIARLDKDLLPQPEGITFLANGDLFVASESGRGRGRLLRYSYTPS
ncbi:MAG: hypothetical protein HKN37_05230 [Rhodothermales bacterium]|nr:hypothetical protein [Rhodothermales bacterium]